MRGGRVEARADFFLVVALALYWDDQGVVPLALLACTLHELGHLAALYLFGGQLSRLRLTGVGAEMVVRGDLGYGAEMIVALSGPAINLVIAFVLAKQGGNSLFCGVNLVLGSLNLIPMARLDGGRIVYAAICMIWGTEWAGQVGSGLDGLFSGLILLAGVATLVMGGSFTLLILGVWMVWTQKTWKFHKKRLA